MEPIPTKIAEVMEQKAKVCETISQDKTEESLTGDSCEKEMNEQEAKEWKLKSKVWLEAEAIVQSGQTGQTPPVQ